MANIGAKGIWFKSFRPAREFGPQNMPGLQSISTPTGSGCHKQLSREIENFTMQQKQKCMMTSNTKKSLDAYMKQHSTLSSNSETDMEREGKLIERYMSAPSMMILIV